MAVLVFCFLCPKSIVCLIFVIVWMKNINFSRFVFKFETTRLMFHRNGIRIGKCSVFLRYIWTELMNIFHVYCTDDFFFPSLLMLLVHVPTVHIFTGFINCLGLECALLSSSYIVLLLALSLQDVQHPFNNIHYICVLRLSFLAGDPFSCRLSSVLEKLLKSILWAYLLSKSEFIYQCDCYFQGQDPTYHSLQKLKIALDFIILLCPRCRTGSKG